MANDYKNNRRDNNRAAYNNLVGEGSGGHIPPQALDLEEAVLGALMLEKDGIITVQEYLTADAFYSEQHRIIFKAIEELSTELKPIDLLTVTEKLKQQRQLKAVGGAQYLKGAAQRCHTSRFVTESPGTPYKISGGSSWEKALFST